MPDNSTHTALTLFEQLGRDSEPALSRIIQVYQKPLVRYILRYVHRHDLATEVFHDAMLALWINRKKVALLKDPMAWVATTAHNKALNKKRDEMKVYTVPVEDVSQLKDATDIEAEIEYKELSDLIRRAEEQLSPKEQEVFLLNKHHGLSKEEIAQKFGTSENTVRNQLSNAVKHLRDILKRMITTIFF